MLLRGPEISNSWTQGDKYYTFDNRIFKINAVGEIKLSLPLVWRFGLSLNARFMFEPLPFAFISYDVYQGKEVKYETHSLYTKFNLGGIINAGVYFDNDTIRISAGYGRGSYDVYNSYRRATIDGHNMKQHIPLNSNRYIHNVFLSFAVYM
jgi:hypothetical protein